MPICHIIGAILRGCHNRIPRDLHVSWSHIPHNVSHSFQNLWNATEVSAHRGSQKIYVFFFRFRADFKSKFDITASIKHCTVFLYSQNDWESLVLPSLSPIILVGDSHYYDRLLNSFLVSPKINYTALVETFCRVSLKKKRCHKITAKLVRVGHNSGNDIITGIFDPWC